MKFVGLLMFDKVVMRAQQALVNHLWHPGMITRGGYSPSLQQSIALARVPIETEEQVNVSIRQKTYPARVTKPRFIAKGKILIK